MSIARRPKSCWDPWGWDNSLPCWVARVSGLQMSDGRWDGFSRTKWVMSFWPTVITSREASCGRGSAPTIS